MQGARKLSAEEPPLTDLVCFHCQQAAEKYLKALLQELALPVPRIHDLLELLDRLLPHDATLGTLRKDLIPLNRYAVEYRYPGRTASARQVRAALRRMERTRQEVRTRLGLKP